MAKQKTPPATRFWPKVDKSGDCWVWTGALLRNGYGYFGVERGRCQLAHRWAYESAHGLIPIGLVIDHLCRNKACVNPAHLEAVTQSVNVLRGDSPATIRALRAGQTHCRRAGHEYTPENTYRDKRGRRACKECARTGDRERKRALRAKGSA